MNLFTKVLDFLVWSSVNSDKLSLTLKSGASFLVLLGVEQATGDSLADGITGFIFSVAQMVAFAGMVWGSARKVAVGLKNFWDSR